MFVFFHRSVAGSFGNLERNRSLYLMDLQAMVYQKYYLIFWEGSSYPPFFVSIFTKVCSLCWEFFGFIMFLTNMKLDESHVWNISGSKASFLRFSYQECLHWVCIGRLYYFKIGGNFTPTLFRLMISLYSTPNLIWRNFLFTNMQPPSHTSMSTKCSWLRRFVSKILTVQ